MARSWTRGARIARWLGLVVGLGLSVGALVTTIRAENVSPPAEAPAVCAMLAPGAGPTLDAAIPFQTLAQGNVGDHGPPRSLLTVTATPDPVVRVIDPAAAQAVAGVDFGTHVV